MRAEHLVEVVDRNGLAGLMDELSVTLQKAEALDIDARRLVAQGFGSSEVGAGLTTRAINRQQAIRPPSGPTANPDTERVLRALDRLERAPTGDEIASRQAQDRRLDVERRNRDGAEANRQWAQQLQRGGYAGFTGGDR
jgi:hypothetical protein